MGKLGIYLLANYPTKELFLEAVKACGALGVDFLEVGMPFSDPVADGDVLERASREVLRAYPAESFTESVREAGNLFPGDLYVMTYANVIYSQNPIDFFGRIGPVSGLIVADLPVRETPMFQRHLGKTAVNLIRFLTPESRAKDITLALAGAKGFIYFVSKRGTTGGPFTLDDETREKISLVRGHGIDVFLGFGISERRDVELACSVADGAIIGTKAVRELGRGVEKFRAYLTEVAAPTRISG